MLWGGWKSRLIVFVEKFLSHLHTACDSTSSAAEFIMTNERALWSVISEHTHTHTQCYWCAAFRAAYLLHKNGPVLLGSGLVIGEERRASPRRSELCATLRHVCHCERWIKTPADSFFLYIRTVCDSSASVKPHPEHSLLDNEALALLCL